MALDEPKEGDISFENGGVIFVVEKDLYESAKPIHIDYVKGLSGEGFLIRSSLPQCGGCCS